MITESPSWIKFTGTWLTPSGEVKYDQSKFLIMLNKKITPLYLME